MASLKAPPIVFTIPGLTSDMCIEVFGKDFHVHSVILKARSEYFRKYLDSPDKSHTPCDSPFRYNWVTQIDTDGTGWSLTSVEKSDPTYPQIEAFIGSSSEQIEAFESILCALHDWKFTVTTARQLCLITDLADFYRVLPVMSNALHGVFFGNEQLVSSIPQNCIELLSAATKLRNKPLFRECFVHAMGPWNEPRFLALTDKSLKDVASKKHAQLCQELLLIQSKILTLTATPIGDTFRKNPGHAFGDELIRMLHAQNQSICGVDKKLALPSYYRHARETRYSFFNVQMKALLDPLLKNVLVLDRSGVQAGEGIYRDFFLCFELTDQELPWDTNQNTW